MALRSRKSDRLPVAEPRRALQPTTIRCECGQMTPVVQMTPYEFDYACACGRCGCISWSHKLAPPYFVILAPKDSDAVQQSLGL